MNRKKLAEYIELIVICLFILIVVAYDASQGFTALGPIFGPAFGTTGN